MSTAPKSLPPVHGFHDAARRAVEQWNGKVTAELILDILSGTCEDVPRTLRMARLLWDAEQCRKEAHHG